MIISIGINMADKTQSIYKSYIIEEYFATEKPYYVPVGRKSANFNRGDPMEK